MVAGPEGSPESGNRWGSEARAPADQGDLVQDLVVVLLLGSRH